MVEVENNCKSPVILNLLVVVNFEGWNLEDSFDDNFGIKLCYVGVQGTPTTMR